MKKQLKNAAKLSLMISAIVPTVAMAKNKATQHPNVVFIIADDMGYGDLSCYGQQKFSTPNIDRLAKEGVKFTQNYAGNTVSAPSRCSLMTGLHQGHAEVRGNMPFRGGDTPLKYGTLTLGDVFKNAGYTTGLIGKWAMGWPDSEGAANDHGFDFAFGYGSQLEAHHHYPVRLFKNKEEVYIKENENKGRKVYAEDLFINEAEKFITENKDKPFFLYMPIVIPHASLSAPKEYVDRFDGKFPEKPYPDGHYRGNPNPHAVFAAMITRLDDDVARINKLLKKLGLDENTIVVFTSDNGAHVEGGADPKFFNGTGGLRGVKRDMYEGGIRVPFIVKWPAAIKAGQVNNHVQSFYDVVPTMCQLLDQPEPIRTDGISFLPTLTSKGTQKEHDFLYWEFHVAAAHPTAKQAVRMGDWKGIRLGITDDSKGKAIELYNLKDDVKEAHNVADQHPEVVKQIEQIMEREHRGSDRFPFGYESGKKPEVLSELK